MIASKLSEENLRAAGSAHKACSRCTNASLGAAPLLIELAKHPQFVTSRWGLLVGQPSGGLSCQPRSAGRRAVAPASGRVWSTFGPHAIGAERFAAVSNGLQREVIRAGCRRDPAEQARGQNPDKDEVRGPDESRSLRGARRTG